MEDMARYCDNIVVLNKSEVMLSGCTSDVFSHAKELAQVGLDIPEIAHIAEKLKEAGFALGGKLYTVEGVKNAILKYIGQEVRDVK